MEVRILTMDEMPQALGIARGVFDYCLKNTVTYPQMITAFENYTSQENIRQLMEQSRLTLWGVFLEGKLVAMSGMQSEGHITMLYVLPYYQKGGCGSQLLQSMRAYAGTTLRLPSVTLNALPPWTSQYFLKNKFKIMDSRQTAGSPYISLCARVTAEMDYPIKKIPAGWVMGTALGGLLLCMFTAFGFMISYLLQV